MNTQTDIKNLVGRFAKNIKEYKKEGYNEHSCRDEFINPFLEMLGWDVTNKQGVAPQFREVIAEYHANQTDRPDYSLTLRGVAKFFVEAKKPHVDISKEPSPAIQTRKYGWNANHKIAVLTNFEYLIIYDTTTVPKISDNCTVSRYRMYHYTEYVEKFDEIASLISKQAVYNGDFDRFFDDAFNGAGSQKQPVDKLFLSQINKWRIALSDVLYKKGGRYSSLNVLNDVVQEFINQVVFLRICEDRNLPLYHKLKDTIADKELLQKELEILFREADKRYNSGMFSGEYIVFDLNNDVISNMIQELYYPNSPYLFSIIEPNMLGKIYEMFLTEQLTIMEDGNMGLALKKDCVNRSIVTTPAEIVKYMTEKTLQPLCSGKTPQEICNIHIADIACGSGVYLEEAFQYLQSYCVDWYMDNDKTHLIETGNGGYKLPLEEKKEILCSCIYGIDIDIHAVEVAKFSLLVKLIEDETEPSVRAVVPILPDLNDNIHHGNSLIGDAELKGIRHTQSQVIDIVPFNWSELPVDGFDAIIGNPPYVTTEDMHLLLTSSEFSAYKKKYTSSYKQFDKYFIFVERALQKVNDDGYVCYIVPNRFFKIVAGKNLRKIISENNYLVSLDDFGAAQLFEDRTIYSSIIFMRKSRQESFTYSNVDSASSLWLGDPATSITLNNSMLDEMPWKLTSDIEFLKIQKNIEGVSVPLNSVADIFNGIQTSAERPPVYWFSNESILDENDKTVTIKKNNKTYTIEKAILKPYFKPTEVNQKGMTTYDTITTDKRIIVPYDNDGKLIPIERMKADYNGAYTYLLDNFELLKPKSLGGSRDVAGATEDTWYQYGRKQAITAFIDTPKLIVKVMAKDKPMYALDESNMYIASGGTAGYCAIAKKEDSQYELEYIQAWLSNHYTEQLISIIGCDFESGFVSRGTSVLSVIPFVKLDFTDRKQKNIYNRVVKKTRQIYGINLQLQSHPAKSVITTLNRQKATLIQEVDGLISRVYRLEF